MAIDLDGTEVCDWLTSQGITCVLLKYRVPSLPYDWHCDCRPYNFVRSTLPLEDAQRTAVCTRLSMRRTKKAAVRILRWVFIRGICGLAALTD